MIPRGTGAFTLFSRDARVFRRQISLHDYIITLCFKVISSPHARASYIDAVMRADFAF